MGGRGSETQGLAEGKCSLGRTQSQCVCVCGGISEVSSKQDFVPLPPSFPLSLSLRIGNIKIVVYGYNKLEA